MMDVDIDDDRKRQLGSYSDNHNAAAAARKRLRTPATSESTENNCSDEEGEVMAAWLTMEDDENKTVSHDLSKLLETEITLPVKVKIIDDPHSSSPLIFQSSTSYVTINGNEESCGSSFSESECSVMVGINSGVKHEIAAEGGGAWEVEEARGWITGEGISGGDCFMEYDDEMLEKFLGEDFCGVSV